MSRARDLLLRSMSSDGGVYVKLISDTDRGKIYEFINETTGRTEAFRFIYPDGRSELRRVTFDPWVDGDL